MMRAAILLLLWCAAANADIRDIVTRLRSANADGMDVPSQVALDLKELKHAIRDIIVQTVTAPENSQSSAGDVTARVIEQLGVPLQDEAGYGRIDGIELSRPAEYSHWLIASVSLQIPYGVDTSLYVFEERGAGWRLAMAVETNGYRSIDGAQGWLTYRVGISAEGGLPFLVTSEVTPSMASIWQGLRLRAFRVGAHPDRPVVLVRRLLGINIVQSYQVAVHNGGFALLYEGSAAEPDQSIWPGVRYLEYSLGAGAAKRVIETAVDPIVWIHRWAWHPWTEASAMVDSAGREAARPWHEPLRSHEWGCGLGGVQLSTRVDAGREVLYAVVPCEHVDNNTPSVYAVFRGGSQGFRLATLSVRPPEWLKE